MNERVILETELDRTRKFREEREKIVKSLKQLNAPQIIINDEIEISKMSHKEYQNYIRQEKEESEREREEWIKNNPMREEVVNNIFDSFECDNYNENELEMIACGCGICLGQSLDPLGDHIGMTQEEYYYDLYKPLITSIAKKKLEDIRNKL